jgi:MoaA/NifB/PqqE/SkfB family radical SAM enzyme
MIGKYWKKFRRLVASPVKWVSSLVPPPLLRWAKLWYYRRYSSGPPGRKERGRDLTVLLDVNNICNLDCIMCSRGSVPERTRNMTPEEFERIGDQCLFRAKDLQVCCSWELSISKHAPAILRLLPKYRIPYTSAITNGNFISEELLESFFLSGIDEVTFSIGEATRETYEKIRVGGDFDRILQNIARLVERKKASGSERPMITANLTIMRSNLDELVDFVDLAADIGIECLRGRHMLFLEECPVEGEILVNEAERTNQTIRRARRAAKARQLVFDVPYLDPEPRRDYSCFRPWTTLYISSDGSLSVCPRIKELEPLGNLLEKDFEELFYSSEPIRKLREDFAAGRHNEVCRWCMSGVKERERVSQKF